MKTKIDNLTRYERSIYRINADDVMGEGVVPMLIESEVYACLDSYADEVRRETITEETSDGYHTFKELYEFRKIFNALLFNEWARQERYFVHKSKKHSDGEDCFGGGWFIVVSTLPTGQVSNHYEMKDWDLFACQIRERADKWDGHTAQDVLERLAKLQTKIDEK